MPRPVDAKASYFPGLDGLRALAVGLVVAYHLGVPGTDGGLLGVGVFFTLSGYLITSLLLRRHERHGDLDLKNFWIRRFRRLLPAVVLVLIAVLAATALVSPDLLGARLGQSVAALLYVANWHTILSGRSYFDQAEGAGPLDHLWSLAVEEQFYLVWPLVLLGLLALTRRLGPDARRRVLAAATLVLGAVSFVLLAVFADPAGDSTRAYEGTDTRAGGLLWGAVLAFLWRPDRVARLTGRASRVVVDLVGVLGLAGVLALSATTGQEDAALYTWGLAALTVATCAALLPLVHPGSWVARVLGIPPLQWIGARSYGIYLWHMPVVAFLPDRVLFGQPVLRGLLIVALTLVLAALSWRLVEDPIRRHGLVAALARARGVLGVGAVAVLASGALVLTAALPQTSAQEIAAQEPAAPAGDAVAHPALDGRTSCTSVLHVGDSTSLASGNTDRTRIADPAQRITGRYEAVGVETVVEDIAGGRSTREHIDGSADLNAPEAVAAGVSRLDAGGCVVVNVGLNDAATMTKDDAWDQAAARIDAVVDAADGRPVLWVGPAIMPWSSRPYYEPAGAERFTRALVDATARHPDLRVHDWARESRSHPDWYLSDDANHNTEAGAVAKARSMAAALTAAFPAGRPASAEKVVLGE